MGVHRRHRLGPRRQPRVHPGFTAGVTVDPFTDFFITCIKLPGFWNDLSGTHCHRVLIREGDGRRTSLTGPVYKSTQQSGSRKTNIDGIMLCSLLTDRITSSHS